LKEQQISFTDGLMDTLDLIIKILERITDRFEEMEAKIADFEKLAEFFEKN
jgi:hypothetical protein